MSSGDGVEIGISLFLDHVLEGTDAARRCNLNLEDTAGIVA